MQALLALALSAAAMALRQGQLPRSPISLLEAGRGAGQARLLEIAEQRPALSSLLQSEAAQYGICTGDW